MSSRLRPLLLLAAAGLAACAGDVGSGGDDDGTLPDGNPGCTTFIAFEPADPVASATVPVRANARVQNAPGVIDYTWFVTFQGVQIAHAPAQDDSSAITFPAVSPGVYSVHLRVGSPDPCPTAQAELNVKASGANQTTLRLQITPPPGANVPPSERAVPVSGGADLSVGTVALDGGVTAPGQVKSGSAGVTSYVRLMPLGTEDTAVEAYTGGDGKFSARVQNFLHDVLVIPAVPGAAPWLVTRWMPTTSSTAFAIGPWKTVRGVVRRPGGAALAGAKVQLKIGRVPSTIGTTAADGSFSLLVQPLPGELVAVDVTPPAGSGLPRLRAQSTTMFDLDQDFQIGYVASLALRDLGGATGATVVRAGAAVSGAKLTLVGGLPAIGTVATGAAPGVSASGSVQITATTSTSGKLPSTLAPARLLTAVVEVVPNDHAVAAIDLTSGTPAEIDAPPAVPVSTQLRRPDGTPIADAVLDAVPVGALAAAGVASTLRVRSGTGGQISASLAAGGHYDLRVHDPVRGRGAPLIVLDATAPLAASYTLQRGLVVRGTLLLQGSPTPVGGAALQVLCATCLDPIERSRPIAEGTSLPDGTFTLIVPDPGIASAALAPGTR